MKLNRIILLVITLLIVAACSRESEHKVIVEAEPQELTALPDTLAAQDDYTRSFLVSTDEVEKDFYEMRTWTDAYSMWIPTNATLDKTFYEKSQQHWEKFLYAWNDVEGNISYGLYGIFEDSENSEIYGLDELTSFSKFEGEYEKTEDESNIYYYGKRIKEIGMTEDKTPVYSHIGFIKHKTSGKSLGILHQHHCGDWTDNCTADTEGIKEDFWKIVKSVKFDKK